MAKPLPPLNSIRAFEAASRHLNLSRAAEELGVTQGAISKQVIALEGYIGAQLFLREPGGLQLTVEGGNLKEAIKPAFAMLAEAFSRYSRRAPRSNVVRISTLASFASQFLVPRLSEFKQHHPEIELEFLTSQRLVDFSREDIDIGVRYGSGQWDGAISTKLVDGLLVPVCTPALHDRAKGDVGRLFDLTRRVQHTSFNEWTRWGELADLDLSGLNPTFVIEDFLVALRAVLTGEGVALLPEILVRDQLVSKELVEFSNVRVPTDYTYHIAYAPSAERRESVRNVIDWLKGEAAGTL
jgi:LysR family glycine cleavage system transcriptional activator